MEKEYQLNQKLFFESLIEKNEIHHPIKLLGDLYMAEMEKEVSDLSFIRFSQGEVYFHNRDFEAAIFKWENINNELEAWAKKNIADAYFELDILQTAEEIYKGVQTDSVVLQTEVLLQLFSLYIEQNRLEQAVENIKKAVELNPDYPDVTVLARAFFEEQQDWQNAIELAVNEAVRLNDLSWFHTLQSYVEKGYTKKIEPHLFNQALVSLYKLDLAVFEDLTISFWNSYKQEDLYFSWLKEINYLLLHMERNKAYKWQTLSTMYFRTYFDLIDGRYLIKDLTELVPNHLINWMKIANQDHLLISAASLLAWYEIFTTTIDPEMVSEAEGIMNSPLQYEDGLADGYKLFESINAWAERNGVPLGMRFEWMVKELLDLEHHHLLITGTASEGKEAVITSILHKESAVSASIMYKDNDGEEIMEINDEGISKMDRSEHLEHPLDAFISWKSPFPILRDEGLALIDTPIITGRNKLKNGLLPYLPLADSLLFVLDRDDVFSERDLDIVVKIREHAKDLPIHFLLNVKESEEELIALAASKISTYFPKAKLFPFSGQTQQLREMIAFLKGDHCLQEKRTGKILYTIRKTIKYLLERRVEIENGIIDKIKWNEEFVSKLVGATNQLRDLEEEKVRIIKRNFEKMKDEMKEAMIEEIPRLLQNCSEFLHEDSDFGKIHLVLNEEMNKRTSSYMNKQAMPRFHSAFLHWISESNEEFEQAQHFLNEMSAGMNELYGDDKLLLECDFMVLDDWRRDADRLTRGNVQVDEMNILLRYTPSQLFLKSAGKIFGALQQNKTMLYKRYKQYIENEDYHEVAAKLADDFLLSFDLFEKTLDRDIQMFFKNSHAFLKEKIDESDKEIETSKVELQIMRTNPEAYRDPLTLFQVKLLQYEWMSKAGEAVHR